MSQSWPLFQLRLQTPTLELRLPSDSDLDELASLAAGSRLGRDHHGAGTGLEPCLPMFGLTAGAV